MTRSSQLWGVLAALFLAATTVEVAEAQRGEHRAGGSEDSYRGAGQRPRVDNRMRRVERSQPPRQRVEPRRQPPPQRAQPQRPRPAVNQQPRPQQVRPQRPRPQQSAPQRPRPQQSAPQRPRQQQSAPPRQRPQQAAQTRPNRPSGQYRDRPRGYNEGRGAGGGNPVNRANREVVRQAQQAERRENYRNQADRHERRVHYSGTPDNRGYRHGRNRPDYRNGTHRPDNRGYRDGRNRPSHYNGNGRPNRHGYRNQNYGHDARHRGRYRHANSYYVNTPRHHGYYNSGRHHWRRHYWADQRRNFYRNRHVHVTHTHYVHHLNYGWNRPSYYYGHYGPVSNWRYHQRYYDYGYNNRQFAYYDGLCRYDDNGDGAIVGAVLGAIIGGSIAYDDDTAVGILLGAGFGALVGASIDSFDDCDRAQYQYAMNYAFEYGQPYYWANPYSGIRGTVSIRDSYNYNNRECRYGDAEIYMPDGTYQYDQVRMCRDDYGGWQVAAYQ